MRLTFLLLVCILLVIPGCLFNDNSSDDESSTEPPLAPSELTYDVSTPYTITLHWKDNSDNEDGFLIGTDIHVPANTTTWTFTNLEDPTYDFALYAYNDAGLSEYVVTDEIKVTWEYPHFYKIFNVDTESNGEKGTDTANGFITVYEDSVKISFTCSVGGKDRVVDIFSSWPYPFLTFDRDHAWYTQYFEYDNYEQNKCSVAASRIDSLDE